jgi:hypothetical protein
VIDGIPIGLANGVGVVAVVAILGWLMASGRLLPRSFVERMEAQYQRELNDIGHDRDEWRAAHRISEQARLEEREHNRGLVEDLGATVTSFLAGFRKAADDVTRQHTGDPL